jgi:hypothetical protein
MTQTLITYLFVWVVAIFVVLSFAIGLEKMIKVILGNYVLWGICFAASASIDLAVNSLQNTGFTKLLSDWKSTIVLVLYAILLFLIYHKSKISIDIPSDQIMQKSLYLVFVPLTVLSMCLTLEIILLGTNVLTYKSLMSVVAWFSKNIYLQQFIVNTPYWVLIHGLATIFITSEFKTKFKSDI